MGHPQLLPLRSGAPVPGSGGVVIVGGGISGLSTAYYLAKQGVRSTVIEKLPRLGGLILTESVEGCIVEGGPDSYLAAKPWATELIRDLGLESQLIGSNDSQRVTYIWRGGRLVRLPDGLTMMIPTRIWPVAASPLLSWTTKLRMGLDYFRRRPGPEEDRSIAEFIGDHYGEEAVEYLAEPLLAGVLGGEPEKLSAAAVLPRFVEIEKKYGSLTRGLLAMPRPDEGPLFRTLKGGLGTLIEALRQAVQEKVEFVHGEVDAVETGWRVRVNGEWLQAPELVLACAAHASAKLLAGAAPELARLLGSIEHSSAVTVMFGFRRAELGHPLNGFGFLVPRRERKLLLASTWVDTKFEGRATGSHSLIRCFAGQEGIELTDEELAGKLRGELAEKMGITAQPAFVRIQRWPKSMPQYQVGHGDLVSRIRSALGAREGLHLAGNALYGFGIPDCVRVGREVATRIAARR